MDGMVVLGLAGITATLVGAAIGAFAALTVAKRQGQDQERRRFSESQRLACVDFLALTERLLYLATKVRETEDGRQDDDTAVATIQAKVDGLVDDVMRFCWAVVLVDPQMEPAVRLVGAEVERLGRSMEVSEDEWEIGHDSFVDAQMQFARVARMGLGIAPSD